MEKVENCVTRGKILKIITSDSQKVWNYINKFWNCLVHINSSRMYSFVEELHAKGAEEIDLYSSQINPNTSFLGFVLLMS
jgi:hypothetical protein